MWFPGLLINIWVRIKNAIFERKPDPLTGSGSEIEILNKST